MKTLQIIKKKIRSLLSAPSNPFQYPDSSTETNSLSSFQPFHKTRSLDLDNQFSKESHNLKTLKLQKDFECQVSSESLKISESSNFEKKIEVQTENSAKKSKNDQLNKYLDPEESTQFFLSQIQTKNAEIQNLHQELKDLEERYEKDLLKFQSENEKLVVFVNELQDQLQTLKMIHEKCKEKHQEFQENIEKYKKNLKTLHENNSKLENAVKRLKSEAEIKEKIKENQAEDLAEAIFDKVGSYEDKKILQACLCKIWNANFEVLEVRFKQDLLKRIFGDGFEEFFLISQNRIKSLQAEIRNYELLLFEKKIEKKTQKRLDREKREQKLGKRVSFSGFEYEASPSRKKDSKNPDYKKISEITSTDLLNFLQCSASLLEELSWNQ
jgi:DNA repair exonuclease SbcCD ATPase subunit